MTQAVTGRKDEQDEEKICINSQALICLFLALFQILRNSTEREVKKYDCCEEPYPSLKFHLTLQRRFKVTDQGVVHNPRMSQGCNLIDILGMLSNLSLMMFAVLGHSFLLCL